MAVIANSAADRNGAGKRRTRRRSAKVALPAEIGLGPAEFGRDGLVERPGSGS
ncbi:hypothetical protein AB0I68_19955 [Streptomyces sp. NPDC050448]|uniref:hypothetical protein n=1 Tax=Streptomyces sp. NPDC050448 TaxID=3155404 RepID=UPI0034349C0A